MKQYLVDTNILLRYLLNDVPNQVSLVEKYVLDAKNGKVSLFVPTLVFVELDFALTRFYATSKTKTIDYLRSLAKAGYLEIEKRDILLLALFIYETSGVSFVDAFFAAESIDSGKTLFTFDQRLQKLTRRQKIL